jgi:hypothetical protein
VIQLVTGDLGGQEGEDVQEADRAPIEGKFSRPWALVTES